MKCEIEDCSNIARHSHHIISKSKGGKNTKENLCNICPVCHDDIHRDLLVIEGKFMTTDGLKIISHRKNQESITNVDLPEVYLLSSQ
jgi:hypothetical protein